ncbi:hypothetical protein [Streptomyces sp. NPDC003247]|uniref:aromatic-ring hydroxylase C-terminal domain-containing protein n=1 Tax=Streptomyces sp. NPDC003247 TaxID=3364677 RepID=UPI003677FA6B
MGSCVTVLRHGSCVTTVTVTRRDDHADLHGVTAVLVRPDGHIAWATRVTDPAVRRDECRAALTVRAGNPAHGL